MTSASDDTIFALSSGLPPAGIAIVRISGREAGKVLRTLAGALPVPRRATHSRLRAHGELLDHGMILWFPGPHSATGEDLAELHLHGGRAVVRSVLAAVGQQQGCRLAEPGEFTRRALMHGRIDLAEAEGLADLLSAETEGQRRQALRLAEGGLSRLVTGWRDRLLEIAASVEASIEFAEDDDLAIDVAAQREALVAVRGEIEDALHHPPAERLRDGVRIVLAGPTNAGKSSLLNALVGRDAAIATDIPGTTRDLVEVPVVHDGLPVVLVDTAGLRSSNDPIERIGMARSRDAIESADLILWLGSPDAAPRRDGVIAIYARADARTDRDDGLLRVSAKTGMGIASLWGAIAASIQTLLPSEDRVALNHRHRALLAIVSDITRDPPADPVLLAEILRVARTEIDRIVGASGVEAMLDTLFGRFCIGK